MIFRVESYSYKQSSFKRRRYFSASPNKGQKSACSFVTSPMTGYKNKKTLIALPSLGAKPHKDWISFKCVFKTFCPWILVQRASHLPKNRLLQSFRMSSMAEVSFIARTTCKLKQMLSLFFILQEKFSSPLSLSSKKNWNDCTSSEF